MGFVVEDSKPEGEWSGHADMSPNGARPELSEPEEKGQMAEGGLIQVDRQMG